jgi:hypothetical protein
MGAKWSVGVALSAIAMASGSAVADEAASEIESLRRTVARLSDRLAELESRDGERWLGEERAAQIRGIVQDVLADAESRESFQSDGAVAGYAPGRGFFLQSADGAFSLRVGGQIQARYIVNDAGGQGTAYGFQMRRVKLQFQGHVIDQSWRYQILGAFNRNTGAFQLENAYIDKDLGEGFSVRAGQFKAPWLQEDLVSSRRQLAVERSLLAGYFAGNFDRGIQLQYETDDFRVRLWTGNGIQTPFRGGSASTITANWNNNPTAYAFVGRGEVKFGEAGWSDFMDFNSFRGGKSGVVLGVSGLAQRYGQTTGRLASAGVVTGVTGDVTVNFGGASLFASGVYETGTNVRQASGGIGDATPWGFLVQGGYFVTETVELFGRYEYGNLSQSAAGYTDNDLNLVTVGANWFIRGHDLKFTVDWGINLDSLGRSTYGSGFGSNDGAGYRTDLPGQDLQWSLRAQMQLLF